MKRLILAVFVAIAPIAAKASVNFEPLFESSRTVRQIEFEISIDPLVGTQHVVVTKDEVNLALDASGDFVNKNAILTAAVLKYRAILRQLADEKAENIRLRLEREIRRARIKLAPKEDDFRN